MVENSPISPQTPLKQKLKHLFSKNLVFIQNILAELSFFVASRSLHEMDKIYTRCAGTLPLRERQVIKETVIAVQKVDSFERFWVTMGMDAELTENEDIQRNIGKYIDHILKNIDSWKLSPQSVSNNFKVPKLDENSIANFGILQVNSELERKQQELLAEERRKHRGYPVIDTVGKFYKLTCLYPECQKTFKCRDHLFAHLKKMIDPDKMIRNHHQVHFALKPGDIDPTSSVCAACKKVFDSPSACAEHYATLGTPGYKLPKDRKKEKAIEPPKQVVDPYENPNECVVCMDSKRSIVNVPCGHVVLCDTCGPTVKICPICRVRITDRIKVYYS